MTGLFFSILADFTSFSLIKLSILREVEIRIYIGSLLYILYNAYLFIKLFFLAFKKPSILGGVETRIYIGHLSGKYI